MVPPLHFRLTREATSGILHLGGTILGTSRTNPFKKPGGAEMVVRNLSALNVGAVVAIGGGETPRGAPQPHPKGGENVRGPQTTHNQLPRTHPPLCFATLHQNT